MGGRLGGGGIGVIRFEGVHCGYVNVNSFIEVAMFVRGHGHRPCGAISCCPLVP